MARRFAILILLAYWSCLSWAAGASSLNDIRVTAADVAQAIRSSSTASAQLKQYADSVGSLAVFESGGRLSVYNGSCCYGVLQMNRGNIHATTKVTPEQFRLLPLQEQVNAWATTMSSALRDPVVRQLSQMSTFGGRVVDGSMILACVQLGQGNCQKMIRSGSCNGFADINGTTICRMADKIASGTTSTAATAATPATGDAMGLGSTRAVSGYGGAYTGAPRESCITDGYGHCAAIEEAMAAGFQSGSGVSMGNLRAAIQTITVAVTALIFGSVLLGLWQAYAGGQYTNVQLIDGIRKAFIAVMIVFTVITMV